jgi:phage-related protein
VPVSIGSVAATGSSTHAIGPVVIPAVKPPVPSVASGLVGKVTNVVSGDGHSTSTAQGVIGAITRPITTVPTVLTGTLGGVTGATTGTLGGVTSTFGAVTRPVLATVTQAVPALTDPIVPAVASTFGTLAPATGTALSTTLSTVGTTVGSVARPVLATGQVFSSLADPVAPATVSGVVGTVTNVAGATTGLVSSVGNGLGATLGAITQPAGATTALLGAVGNPTSRRSRSQPEVRPPWFPPVLWRLAARTWVPSRSAERP